MKEYISKSIHAKGEILHDEKFLGNIEKAVEITICTLNSGKKLLFAGNGGSASDCNHLATELVSKFYKERKGICAISLASNNSSITAIGNDYGYEKVFARQVEALGKEGDILFAISTSGNSESIINALNTAKFLGLITIGFTGKNPCLMDGLCDVLFKVPSDETPIIQEAHIMLGHLICKIVEENLFLQQSSFEYQYS